MQNISKLVVGVSAALLFATGSVAVAQDGAATVDFGDDASEFSNDGECDDKRFEGSGMTNTPLLNSDIGHDATDCRVAFEAGNLTVVQASAVAQISSDGQIDFGDDASKYSNDDECDDKRFEGSGMTTTPLLDSDIGHDATDCRVAFEAGNLTLVEASAVAQISSDGQIDFGDDASDYSRDNECDDKRFVGPGMTTTPLLDSDVGHDATDCRVAFEAGTLRLRD